MHRCHLEISADHRKAALTGAIPSTGADGTTILVRSTLQESHCPSCGTLSCWVREIRPSVVFRKVTNGFRSDWGAQIHAGYRSVTGTARLSGKSALVAIRELVDGRFVVA